MEERLKENVTQESAYSNTTRSIILLVKVVECTAPVPLTISYRPHGEGV